MDGSGRRTARSNHQVPVDAAGDQLAFVTASSLKVSGPIPHGAILRSIEDVVPGAAGEIVHEAHANMQADRENERRYREAITKLDLRGQSMAFTLTICSVRRASGCSRTVLTRVGSR
jgi:hypothetical protein